MLKVFVASAAFSMAEFTMRVRICEGTTHVEADATELGVDFISFWGTGATLNLTMCGIFASLSLT